MPIRTAQPAYPGSSAMRSNVITTCARHDDVASRSAAARLALSRSCVAAFAAPRRRISTSGKTINLIVGNAAGGGYDVYARLLGAPHARSYIPGEPTIVVRNMPGAGGMAMSNYMYSQAPRDGLTIGMMSRSNPIEPVLGNPAAKFKSEEFTWLGTSSSYEDDAYCLVIRADAPFKTIADVQKPAAVRSCSAALAAGGTDTDIVADRARRVQAQHPARARLAAAPELNLAIQRGEVEGRAIGMSSIQTGLRRLAARGQAALPAAVRPRDALEGPARRADRARARQDRRRQGAARARRAAVPDGAAVHGAARRARRRRPRSSRRPSWTRNKDPDYLREAAQMKIDISPLSGDEIAKIVARIAQTPPAVVARYNEILGVEINVSDVVSLACGNAIPTVDAMEQERP